MSGLLIVGGGGHGKVVANTAHDIGRWDKIAFLDDRYKSLGTVLNWPVLGPLNHASKFLTEYPELIVAIGDNFLRVELLQRFAGMGFHLPNIIHPTAFISGTVKLEQGIVVLAQSAINSDTKIGLGCIINTGAIVEHDCILGKGVHICPGVTLGGDVTIGACSWIGIGSSVIHQISIGENVIIGAGSVIVEDVESNVTVFGNPGRVVKKHGRPT